MTYHLITYGCQMNKSDSERINSLLQDYDFKPSSMAKADFLILNLCSVRQSAIDRVWGKINNIKKINKKTKIILTGCILPSDKKKFANQADLILNITDLSAWPKIINGLNPVKLDPSKYFSITPTHNSNYEAFVPIMTGCNNFCSYCAVPYTRGREKSRPAKEIYEEVYTLIERGYKSIILLGQNVNSYKDRSTDFPKLLKKIDSIKGDYWLNFMSSHPKDISTQLINCFKTLTHLTPHIHFALQSGSDKILKSMNRRYTAKKYVTLTEKLKKANPIISITTDLIVGFPGETKADFNKSASLMRKANFDMVYTAMYSPRPNTAAQKLPDNVSRIEKKKREQVLTKILAASALKNNKKLAGQTIRVLIDSTKNNYLIGKTNQFKHVKIKGNNKKLIGKFIDIKISKATSWNLEGKLVK
jgi:tRNA-2-methylthio-N6-dimethylallyladenosine synthase